MRHLLLVAAGGAIGAGCRHLVNVGALRAFGPGFPAGTLAVNIFGSMLMGLLAGWLALRASGGGQDLRLFLATGILGGFTTFSAFSLDAFLLWERGQMAVAAGYVLLSVLLSIGALVLGILIVRAFA